MHNLLSDGAHRVDQLRRAEEARNQAEPCPGSGTFLDRDKPHRTEYYSGNWGTCPECQGQITVVRGRFQRTAQAQAHHRLSQRRPGFMPTTSRLPPPRFCASAIKAA